MSEHAWLDDHVHLVAGGHGTFLRVHSPYGQAVILCLDCMETYPPVALFGQTHECEAMRERLGRSVDSTAAESKATARDTRRRRLLRTKVGPRMRS